MEEKKNFKNIKKCLHFIENCGSIYLRKARWSSG